MAETTYIESLLHRLRQQAIESGAEKLGSHQLDAHWSLAFACGQPPEAWEIYRVPSLHLMPTTEFFTNHAFEIQEALKSNATWELLRLHAVEKLALDAGMTEQERKSHASPGKVQYYDVATKRWASVDVPHVRWFDSRDITRESVARTKEEFRASVDSRLAKLKQKAAAEPTPKRIGELEAYQKYISGHFQINLKNFESQRKLSRAWLAKLDTTRDFGKALFTLLRRSENEVRVARGISAIGEAWVSETELLYRVREMLPGVEVIPHGQPKWLGRQHLDIWIPAHQVGIEYHGLQHFQPVEFFGGEEAFQRVRERDNRKRSLCKQNSVRLIEIKYDQDVDDKALRALLVQ